MTHARPARRAAALLFAAALAVLAAGGGGEDGGGGTAATTSPAETTEATETAGETTDGGSETEAQSITATEGDFFIELNDDSLTAGSYEIEVVNEGDATHDLVVERDGEDVAASDQIGPGESSTFEVDLEPGEYVFYCSVANHRAMGMEVTVTVA